MPGLDQIIHQEARLRIMAALAALDPEDQLDFRTLARALGLTDGNLGSHLQKLEEAGYIKLEKAFIDRKPRTYLAATREGRSKFAEHVQALRRIVDGF